MAPGRASISSLVMQRVMRRGGLGPVDQRGFLASVFALEYATRYFPAVRGVPDPRRLAKAMLRLPATHAFPADYWRMCKALVLTFGDKLTALASDYRHARLRLLPEVKEGAPVGLVLVPVWSQSRGTPQLGFAVLADDLPTLLRHALSLLLGDEKLGALLCRCKFSGCGKFFLAAAEQVGAGRPRRAYCCREHMRQAHDQGTAERVRATRKRKAEAAARTRK